MIAKKDLKKNNDYLWEIPKTYRKVMKVPARVYATEKMLDEIISDKSLHQLVNVTTLPGIQKYALAMPDAHEGYGFPIGGMAAFDLEKGIISPGGIGYDINCGVRLLKSELKFDEIKKVQEKLANTINREVPSGVGRGGSLRLESDKLNEVLGSGAETMVEMGYGRTDDLGHIESKGKLNNADPALISDRAKKRGRNQIGTLGAGNHFVEVARVEKIFDQVSAQKMGIFADQVVVLIHTGSRGLGHQVATDYIRIMIRAAQKYNIKLVDRELACAPYKSEEGQNYWKAMCAAANYAWANRQMITWEVRKAFINIFGVRNPDLKIVYDVAHNIAKIEKHDIDEKIKQVVVHRKGVTRAFPGQPVIIPGSMGTGSYLLIGNKESMNTTFGSTCHGSGRRMSRKQAKRSVWGTTLKQELEKQGITIRAGSLPGLAEEAPQAYKDVDEVVDVVDRAKIATKVARLIPIAVIKG